MTHGMMLEDGELELGRGSPTLPGGGWEPSIALQSKIMGPPTLLTGAIPVKITLK